VLFGEHRTNQPDDGLRVGKMSATSVRRRIRDPPPWMWPRSFWRAERFSLIGQDSDEPSQAE
jgi:hypothetical protein